MLLQSSDSVYIKSCCSQAPPSTEQDPVLAERTYSHVSISILADCPLHPHHFQHFEAQRSSGSGSGQLVPTALPNGRKRQIEINQQCSRDPGSVSHHN